MTCTEARLETISEKFYDKKYNSYQKYSDDGDELEAVLENSISNDSYVKDYDISSNTLFDSPGYECGYVAIAWVELDNSLHTHIFEWEMN